MTDEKARPPRYRRLKSLASMLEWRPVFFPVSRGRSQRLTLSVKNIPKRQIASSIRLQLISISGLSRIGFAWRIHEETAEIWFWDETSLQEEPGFPVAEALARGIKPCVEVLFRPPIEDGLHLLNCTSGYEGVAIAAQKIRRTRYFADLPDENGWRNFVRDCGKSPDNHPAPPPEQITLLDKPHKEWKIHSSIATPMSLPLLAALAAAALIGILCSGLLAYDIKQNRLIEREREIIEQLRHEKAATLELQKQIADRVAIFEQISRNLAPISQLRVMQILAETGIFAEGTNIALAEWEYRNERLRLLFSVPKENFSLGLFLSTLEKTDVLKDIRLIPDTASRMIGIQAAVGPTPWPAPPPTTDDHSPATDDALATGDTPAAAQ